MTSHLEGQNTRFLPFNLGRNGGAGNPPSWKGFATAYLWESIWARSSVLNLLQHFIQEIEEQDDKGRKIKPPANSKMLSKMGRPLSSRRCKNSL